MKFKMATMCSGIGAPEVGMDELSDKLEFSYENVFACEKDKYAREAYLKLHATKTMYEDMQAQEWDLPEQYADYVVAGIPYTKKPFTNIIKMKLPFKITRPLCFIDLETTGTDVAKDKIVQICVMKFMPDETYTITSSVIDPECGIPTAASDVHGITNETIDNIRLSGKSVPTFKQVAKSIHKMLDGADIGGFNSNQFDVPFLSEEFNRCDIQWPADGTLFVDPMVIYKKNEKRDLSTAIQFYCGEMLEDAHNAEADTIAAAKVLIGQIEKYDYLKGMTIEKLAEESKHNKNVDLSGKLIFNDDGKIIFNFGKHYGKLVYEVFKSDVKYYEWLISDKADGFTSDSKRWFKKLFDKIHQPKFLL